MKIGSALLTKLLLIGILVSGCGQNEGNSDKERATFVKIEQVSNHLPQEVSVFNGYVKEHRLSTLSFRVGGPIAKIYVKQGDFVKAGQLIAEIDKRDYRLQVQSTKTQWEQLKGEYERYKQLVDKDKIPENTFEKIESGYLMAKVGYENAQNQLKDTELRAPFSGYVHDKMTESFQTIGAGHPVVSLIDVSQLEVVVSVSERQLNKVKSSQFSTLTAGQVDNIPVSLLSVNEKTGNDGLYQVKFSFPNKASYDIAPGMTAEINMYNATVEEAMYVSSSAVFYKEQKHYVWLYQADTQKIQKQEVKVTDLKSGGKIEITSGIRSGDYIVTAGVHYLVDGQQVQPIQTPSVTNIGGLL